MKVIVLLENGNFTELNVNNERIAEYAKFRNCDIILAPNRETINLLRYRTSESYAVDLDGTVQFTDGHYVRDEYVDQS